MGALKFYFFGALKEELMFLDILLIKKRLRQEKIDQKN